MNQYKIVRRTSTNLWQSIAGVIWDNRCEMPRHYKRRLGAPLRRDYSSNNLERALEDVIVNNASFRHASETYGVPRSTLHRKYHGNNINGLGRPSVLTQNQEQNIVKAITFAAEAGFPFTPMSLRKFVQDYLGRRGVNASCFIDNMPGPDWLKSFLKRNPQLSVRLSENTKRCRAALSRDSVNSYFNELEKTLAGIPADNIINYDETNLPDDPGRERIITKKGTKHARRTIDSSKSSVSIMFAATASGNLLAPYVVYKSKHLYPEWIEGGPDGCQYNRSQSGWFDSMLFEDWFVKIILPYFKRKDGPKLFIGDNLASHLSESVIRVCEANNIKCTFFLPNSTHRCQPLDLSFFRPLKISWRKEVKEWKLKHPGCIPKTVFPSLLKNPLLNLRTVDETLKSGFRAAGIYPLNRNEVLKHLPSDPEDIIDDALLESFSNIVKESQCTTSETLPKRSKKLQVAAGKSVSLSDLGPKESNVDDHSDEDLGEDACYNAEIENEDIEEETYALTDEVHEENIPSVNDFVVTKFIYDKGTKKEKHKYFVAQIIKINEDDIINIRCMRNYTKHGDIFIFPQIEDTADIKQDDIIKILNPPIISRGRHIWKNIRLGQ